MSETNQNTPCGRGCKATVPPELESENLCITHFITAIEAACADMRRETAMGRTSSTRRVEIQSFVKTTAMRLSDVATGSTRMSDELKKRVLTNFLTLMNLRESVERSTGRFVRIEQVKPAEPQLQIAV